MPVLGSIVQKGKFAASAAYDRVSALKRVDLPTLGRPTIQTCMQYEISKWEEKVLEVDLLCGGATLLRWSIVGRDLVRSEDRNDDDRGEIDLQNCREIFRIVFESPDISHDYSDERKNHNDDDCVDSEKYQIHRRKISTALSVFIFFQKSRHSPRKEFRSLSRNSRVHTIDQEK